MIFIVVRWNVRPERADGWLESTREFTEATRAEEGNLFFDWSRDPEDPNRYTLVEAFRDDAAGAAHVGSDHFKAAMAWLPEAVTSTPEIVNVTIPEAQGWSEMAEVTPREPGTGAPDPVQSAIDEAKDAAGEKMVPFEGGDD